MSMHPKVIIVVVDVVVGENWNKKKVYMHAR